MQRFRIIRSALLFIHHHVWIRIDLLLRLLCEMEEIIQRQIWEERTISKVKNSRATLLISLKLASSMHGIFDWWLKVGIVPTLEFRFRVPLERVEDLIRGENFRRRCFRMNSPRANKRNVYLLISNLLVK